jgi:23S rRNA G2445 N2-methylase RlmL
MGLRVLATTTPGFERVAGEEVRELVGSDATPGHRGTLRFETDAAGVVTLNRYARTLNRTLLVLREGTVERLPDVSRLVESVPLAEYLVDGQAFAVDADRRGDHEFESPDVAGAVGQAIIDSYRAATGHRLPVDLDDPDVTFRAYVHEDEFLLAVDATGPSLHDRPWRVCAHEAPVRPTTAAALVRLSGLSPGERLCDPMCGSGTLPIEAALSVAGRPVAPDRTYALSELAFVDAAAEVPSVPAGTAAVFGRDVDPAWVDCARKNAESAAVEVDLAVADATEGVPDADRIVVNPPYGRRLDSTPETLYEGLFSSLDRAEWKRLVVLTARPDLVAWTPDDRVDARLGRLPVAALVFG